MQSMMNITAREDHLEIQEGNFTLTIHYGNYPRLIDEIFNGSEEDEFSSWMEDYDYVPYQKYLDMKYERDSWEEKYNELSKAYEDVEKQRDEWECRYNDLA